MSNFLSIIDEEDSIERVVKKSNSLVRSYYDLSLTEQRIIAVAITYIKDVNCQVVDIPVASYKKHLGLQSLNHHNHFNEVLKSLRSNTIVISQVDKNTGEIKEGIITGWVDSIRVKEGFITIKFNVDIWEHVVNQKEKYTEYYLDYFLKFKSKYTTRLFEILKSYANLGSYTVKIDELRNLLYLENKYKVYTDLDKKVLEPAINEINSLSNDNFSINISYIAMKVGRKYDSIKFTITKVINNKKSEVDSIYPPEVTMAKSMSEIELFISIKTLLISKFKVIFNSFDNAWKDCNSYSRHALENTYLGLLADDWKDHPITNYKAFFAEHLKRLSKEEV